MSIAELTVQNPWWKDKQLIDSDYSVEQFENAKMQWTPRLMFTFEMDKDIIQTLRGPRQVGKTTMVKHLIKKGLETSEANRFFYWTCDLISNTKELSETITEYLIWARNQTDERLFIFLDEISEVPEWQKAIKYLVDTGMMKNTTTILTGSHAIDLKKSGERLPGRRGQSKKPLNKILLPMKFSEYIEVVDKSLFEKIGVNKRIERYRILSDLIEGKIDPFISKQLVYLDDINQVFDRYLLSGGFPRTVNELYSDEGFISNETYSIYLQWILGDMAKWRKEERVLKQIVRRLFESYSSQISWYSIKNQTDIGSHNTISSYVEALEDSFVLNVVNKLDLSKGLSKYRSEKKIYFHDPFIFHSLRSWVNGFPKPFEAAKEFLEEPEDKSKLVEGVVHNHLARLAYGFNLSDSFHPSDYVYFFKGKKYEIDFLLKNGKNQFVPVEVKYRNKIKKNDAPRMGRLQHGLLLTKKDFIEHDRYTALPVSLFLLLI